MPGFFIFRSFPLHGNAASVVLNKCLCSR